MSLLDSIQSTGAAKPPRIMIYGPGGVGKTTLAAGTDAPVFVFTEDGAGALDVPAFPIAQSLDDVMGAITALYQEEHAFKTLVVDSVTHLEPLLWGRVCAERGVQNIEDVGYGKGYIMALDLWRQFLDGVTALRDRRGMTILLIGHSEVKRFDDPANDAYDRYQPRLHQRAADLVVESMDAVLFATQQTVVTSEEVGFNAKRKRGISTGRRLLYTQEAPAWRAKNRYGLPLELDLAWPAVADAIAGTQKQAA